MKKPFNQVWRIVTVIVALLLLWWGAGQAAAQPPPISLSKYVIDGDFDGADSAWPADLDGDGDIDVVGSAVYARDVAWYENDGSMGFTEHTIDANFGAYSTAVVNLDSDQDLDVIGVGDPDVSIGNPALAWWGNDGDGGFTKHVIDANFYGRQAVGVDVNKDGVMDIVASRYEADQVVWLENDGSQNFTPHVVASPLGPHGVHAGDLDADGDVDILAAVPGGSADMLWWENDGSQGFSTQHTLDSDFDQATFTYAFDLDQDEDLDVLGAATDAGQVAWWENVGEKSFIKHSVGAEFPGAFLAYPGDLDADGDFDLVGVSVQVHSVAWWENDGTQDFTYHLVDSGFVGAKSAFPVDLDRDGRMDIVGAAQSGDDIAWWQNLAPATGGVTLEVSGLDPFYGRGIYTGAYSSLYVGIDGTATVDKQCSGSIDMVRVESLGPGGYVFEEEFDSAAEFSQVGTTVYISDGKAVFDHLAMAGGKQFVSRDIPVFDDADGVRLTVRGQFDWWSSNCQIIAGIADAPRNDGIGLTYGFHGAGCPNQGRFVAASGVWIDCVSDGCSNTADGFPWVTGSGPYTAVLTLGAPTASYCVSGQVRDSGGAGVADVAVSDLAGHSATTDGDGHYAMPGLTSGVHQLAPSKFGHDFSPVSRTVSISTCNATAQDFVSLASSSISSGYYPLLLKAADEVPPPGTVTLYVENETGGLATVHIYATPEGDLSCEVPADASRMFCTQFSAGTYSWQVDTICGVASGETQFDAGDRTLSVSCPD